MEEAKRRLDMIKVIINIVILLIVTQVIFFCIEYLVLHFNKLPDTGVWVILLILEAFIQFSLPILHKKLKI